MTVPGLHNYLVWEYDMNMPEVKTLTRICE